MLPNSTKKSKVTIRAMLIGVLLIPINCFWHIQMTLVWLMNFPAILTFLFNVIFILFILVLINQLLKTYIPKVTLQQGELLTIYTMLCVSTALSGYDMMQCLISLIGSGTWYATSENEWIELFGHYLPSQLVIKDHAILAPFYEGGTTFYITEHVQAWLVPIVCWIVFIIILIWIMLCINVLLRKQWIENERLAYPIVELPFNMTKEGERSIFSNQLVWIGIAISGGTGLLNGISYLYPSVPNIPIWVTSVNHLVTTNPWNAIFSMHITLYPFVIGLGFLMPLSLAFSYWSFYLFWQMQRIVGSQFGLLNLLGFPAPMAQVRGVWIGLLIFAIWGGRQHLSQVLRKSLTGQGIDDSREPMEYRRAILGIWHRDECHSRILSFI